MRKQIYFAATALVTLTSLNLAAAVQCESLWRLPEVKQYSITQGPSQESGNHLKYGFESEFTADEIGPILKYYKPSTRTDSEWLATPLPERVTFVQTQVMRQVVMSEGSGLVRIESVQAPDFLPKELMMDPTGNVEFVMGPFDSLGEYYRKKDAMTALFDTGSMQTTVGTPMKVFYNYLKAKDSSVDRFTGFLKFYSDRDAVEKLVRGGKRYQKNSKAYAARSFNHPFVGPMMQIKMNYLISLIERNSQGQALDSQTMQNLRAQDHSPKYFGGTAYRPDIAPGWLVLEVRDAHKDHLALEERVRRATDFFLRVPADYSRMNSLKAFDSQKDFEKLPSKTQEFLATIFPSKAMEGVNYRPEELIANQVYRNFAWPLRDWSKHQELGLIGSEISVHQLQAGYTRALEIVREDLAQGKIAKDEAQRRVQGALAQFAIDLKIYEGFKALESQLEVR